VTIQSVSSSISRVTGTRRGCPLRLPVVSRITTLGVGRPSRTAALTSLLKTFAERNVDTRLLFTAASLS
jgi:hypothetical protein